jgi:hypothetical protein
MGLFNRRLHKAANLLRIPVEFFLFCFGFEINGTIVTLAKSVTKRLSAATPIAAFVFLLCPGDGRFRQVLQRVG